MGEWTRIGFCILGCVVSQWAHAYRIFGASNAAGFHGPERGTYFIIFESDKYEHSALHQKKSLLKKQVPKVHIQYKNHLYLVEAGPFHSATQVRAIGRRTTTSNTFQPEHRTVQEKTIAQSTPTQSILYPLNYARTHGQGILQVGGFLASEGKAQVINAPSLKGNEYTVNNPTQGNALFGVGYYLNGIARDRVAVQFGFDWLYMLSTPVSGFINLEQQFQNLSYRYRVRNMPLYLAAKALYKNANDRYDWIFDLGAGPNFIQTSGYTETPLTNFTLPNNAFTTHNNVDFTAMIGVGLRAHNVFGKIPLECGYRFMYLGEGKLQANNNQSLNTLSTGHGYANSVICGVVL